jgi:tRNA (guanine26-N2/guanine27-N2)-dimethyltransferase
MRKITEGKAVISVPEQPMTKKAEAFYNPAMEYQRDLTMSFLRVLGGKLSVCDPLAGTGIRAIRMALEVPGIGKIVANDLNPMAVSVMKGNFKANKIDAEVFNVNANDLFLANPRAFGFIDIDPFGSHINYVFNAGCALKTRSMLACTATDTGALCGAFPSTAFTRYGIRAFRTDFYKEIGVRVMITSTMLELSKHGMAFEPIYSHANHYFRILGTVRKSKGMLTRQFSGIKFFMYCGRCLYRSFEIEGVCPVCGRKVQVMGPMWTGKIKDTESCRSMLQDLRGRKYKRTKELHIAVRELDEPFYYDLHRLFRARKMSPVKMEDIMKALEDSGFTVSRTYLSGTGIKTDASYGELTSLL